MHHNHFSNHINIQWIGESPATVFLAQAKHYKKEKVNARDIREFIGASSLAKHKIYAVQHDEKYIDLRINPYSSLVHIFITSEEIKITAKIIALKTGVILLTSSELYEIFADYTKNKKGVSLDNQKSLRSFF